MEDNNIFLVAGFSWCILVLDTPWIANPIVPYEHDEIEGWKLLLY